MTNKRAIIVDDNPSTAMVLEFILEELGIESDSMYQPEQVQEHLQSQCYDFMLLDWMMPVMDGIELLTALRQDPRTTQTKVIMCTARTSDDDKKTALKSGADAFLNKPITVAKVRETLQSLDLLS